ncbi:MAG TPA: amidohydrolase family protein [Steroidobacteraceae bacterium]|nr:amidohydrolase family protein [Steroidobacteraceae bacterium]
MPLAPAVALAFAAAAAALLTSCALPPQSLRVPVVLRQVPFTPDSGTLGVRCGRLIDGVGATARRNTLVIIRDGRIVSLTDDAGKQAAANALVPILDLSDYTCLPGLIDMHTHLTDRPEDTSDLTVLFKRSDEETMRLGKENAAATVLAGFTGARNVGTYVMGTDYALRDEIDKGRAIGPRIQASGPYLTIEHGGGDLYVPGFKEPPDSARFHAGVAHDPDEFRARAQDLVNAGSDLLKVIASGAVLAFDSEPGAPEMTQEDIAAVVEVAHASGRKVAAHAHGEKSILMAIAAGADTIEHASYLGDAGIAAALKRGNVAFSMDVYNGDYIDTEGRRQHWPEEFLRKNVETTEIQRQAFTKAVKAGVPIVFGTDSAVYPHGLNARQFPIMVQRGMTPMQAIKAATSVAAHYMGWDADIGSLEPKKFGDLIAVKKDPLADISALQDVAVVIKGGLPLKLP